MPTRVDIGNGYIAEFPDGMSKDDIREALKKRGPKPDAAPEPKAEAPASLPKAADTQNPVLGALEDTARRTAHALTFGGSEHVIAAADTALHGGNYTGNLAESRARTEEAPSTAIDIAGSLVPGTGVARAVEAVPGMAIRAGQAVRNVARLATTGGVAGAADAALEGKDIPTGAAYGAAAAPVVAGVGKMALAGGRKVASVLTKSGADQGAVRALAKRINEDPAKLDTAISDFKAATGRAPTLVEVVDAGSAEELGKLASIRTSAADKFREAGDNISADRPASFAKKIASGGPVDDAATLSTARKAAMDTAMKPIANKPVTLAKSELESFMDPDARSVLRQPLRAKIGAALEGGPPLTVQDIDNMRQAFSDAAGSGQKHVFSDLSASVRKMGTRAVPEYGRALDEFERFSRGIKGFEHGQTGKLPSDLTSSGDIADAKTPEYAAGRNVGVRSRLVTKADSSERGAVNTANDVLQGATASEMRGALNKGETNNIQAAGLAERQSAERLSQVNVRQRAPSDETADNVKNYVERGVAAAGNTLTGYKAHVISRLITKAHVSSATARRIAELATDPANAADVVAALRRAKLSDQAIRDILMPVSAAVGATAGGSQ